MGTTRLEDLIFGASMLGWGLVKTRHGTFELTYNGHFPPHRGLAREELTSLDAVESRIEGGRLRKSGHLS